MLKKIVLWVIFWVVVFGAYQIGGWRGRNQAQTIAWIRDTGEMVMPYKLTYDPNDKMVKMHYLTGEVVLHFADEETYHVAMYVLKRE